MRLFTYIDWEEIQAKVLDNFSFHFGKDFFYDFNGFLSFIVHRNRDASISIVLVVICLAL